MNCAAIPETLIESELFGHVKGAYSGAITDSKGCIENANNGVLFLDEIGKAPPAVQYKLLRFLREGEIQPVGAGGLIRKVDVATVLAMKENIDELFQQGKLIPDFYSRIITPKVVIPPLRRRKDDIPVLIEYFLTLTCEEQKKSIPILPEDLTLFLTEYSWPHNIGQLGDSLRTMVTRNQGTEISTELSERTKEELRQTERIWKQALSVRLDLDAVCRWLGSDGAPPMMLDNVLGELERRIVDATLKKNNGEKKRTAIDLGIDRGRIGRPRKIAGPPAENSA